jgi:hypothetical protein
MAEAPRRSEAPRRQGSPQEVHDLVTRLQDDGVLNLEAPIRGALERARTLRVDEEEGWYIVGGGGWVIVCRE